MLMEGHPEKTDMPVNTSLTLHAVQDDLWLYEDTHQMVPGFLCKLAGMSCNCVVSCDWCEATRI